MFRDYGGRPQVQNSLGSGVILSDDGIVVSNYHVVGQASDIRVVLNNGAEYEARVARYEGWTSEGCCTVRRTRLHTPEPSRASR